MGMQVEQFTRHLIYTEQTLKRRIPMALRAWIATEAGTRHQMVSAVSGEAIEIVGDVSDYIIGETAALSVRLSRRSTVVLTAAVHRADNRRGTLWIDQPRDEDLVRYLRFIRAVSPIYDRRQQTADPRDLFRRLARAA